MTATKLDLVKVEDWGLFTDTTKPIIIAGPCSAESEQQVFETAKGLKAAAVSSAAGLLRCAAAAASIPWPNCRKRRRRS